MSEHDNPLIVDDIEVTEFLKRWTEGDEQALAEALPVIYGELHKVAGYHLRRESKGHTLQTTALVNEAYLQLVNGKNWQFENRNQFYLLAGQVMRHILVSHARARLARKRGGGNVNTPLDEKIELTHGYAIDMENLVAIDDALKNLESMDPRQCKIVELRFFAGMNNGEIAEILGVSTMTVKREWRTARCWLSRELGH